VNIPSVSDGLLERYDVATPRYTSYPVVPSWEDGFVGYGDALDRASQSDAPLSLYVHIPFCWRLCHYCGCNVVVSSRQDRADAYLDLLEREVDLVAERLSPRRRVAHLHLGGGTPTFLRPGQLRRLWAILLHRFDILADAEVSVEVHPGVTSAEQLDTLRALGCNRLSLGVQDLDADVQAKIGRDQTIEQTQTTLDYARGAGFESVNFDLIYGLPGQTPRTWARTLARVVEMAPDRIAVYGFAYVPKLRPNQLKLHVDELPVGRAKLDLFRQAWSAFGAAGYAFIGLDHFVAPTDELAMAVDDGRLWRNFQGYTVRHTPDTIGFGVTGISDVMGTYAQNLRTLPSYKKALESGRLPTWRGMERTTADTERRARITRLMCHLEVELPAGLDAERLAMQDLEWDGLVALSTNRVKVTATGRLFLRNIAHALDPKPSSCVMASSV
jgi:oxygen-independent coproporphyrinogen III oxidase